MMKSFFKKLAFVMATAMVVTTAAPAAQASAAGEMGVALQTAKSKSEVIASYTMKEGDSVDFKYYGAPKDYLKLSPAWSTSDEDVATVDKYGVVEAVAAGTATITIALNNGMTGSVEVTVEALKPANYFEAVQLSTSVVKLVFDETKNVTVDNLAFGTLYGDTYVQQPVKSVNVNGNEAVVTLYSNLVDGGKYQFTFDGFTADMTASAGDIFAVAYEYWTDKAGDGKAYVATEIEGENSEVTLVPHYYDVNGVDVTAIYPDVEVLFELIEENESVDLIDNIVTFTEPTVAQIMLVVSWLDDEGEDVTREYAGYVFAQNRPALTFEVQKAGVFNGGFADEFAEAASADFLTDPDGYYWSTNQYTDTFIYGDREDGDFAAVVKDSRGNLLVTGDTEYAYGEFVYETTNDKVVTIEEDGSLTIVAEGTANIIISFIPVDAEDEEAEKTYVAYKKITVLPERYPVSYKVSNTSHKAATDSDNTWGSFQLAAFDQYGGMIALDGGADSIIVEATSSKNEVELTVEGPFYDWNDFGWGAFYRINYNGAAYADMIGTDKYGTYKYKLSLDKEENDTISTGNTSLTLRVYNTETYYNNLKADTTDNFEYGPWASTTWVDVVVDRAANYNYTWRNAAVKTVTVDANYLDPTSDLFMTGVDKYEAKDDLTTGEAGTLYYKVSAPKDAVNWSYTATGGSIVLSFNNTDAVDGDGNEVNGGFAYATTGTYKVTLYYAKKDGGSLKTLTTYNITVANSQPGVSFVKFNDELGNETIKDMDDITTANDVIDLVRENMVFSQNSDYITKVTYRMYSNKIYIKKVTFELPVDDWDDATDYTVTKSVTVNRYIYEGDGEE